MRRFFLPSDTLDISIFRKSKKNNAFGKIIFFCHSPIHHTDWLEVNPDDATLLRGAMLPHPPSTTSWEQLAVFSQLQQSKLSDIVGNTWNTLKQRGAVLHGDTVPCFMEQSCIVWTNLNRFTFWRFHDIDSLTVYSDRETDRDERFIQFQISFSNLASKNLANLGFTSKALFNGFTIVKPGFLGWNMTHVIHKTSTIMTHCKCIYEMGSWLIILTTSQIKRQFLFCFRIAYFQHSILIVFFSFVTLICWRFFYHFYFLFQ